MNKTIGIIGYGIVGKSVSLIFKGNTNILVYDPLVDNKMTIKEMSEKCSAIFICIPTPGKENGEVDTSIADETTNRLKESKYNGIVVMKSTISYKWLKQQEDTGMKIIMNPEFLTDKNWDLDTINAKFIVLGGKPEYVEEIKNLYLQNSFYDFNEVKIHISGLREACLMKYMINNFLAMKVIFMNQFYDVYKAFGGTDWNELTNLLKLDSRLGHSHFKVPCDHGRKYGGKCFPKDVNAMIIQGIEAGCNMDLMKTVKDINEKLQ